jgi:hypothetical protein
MDAVFTPQLVVARPVERATSCCQRERQEPRGARGIPARTIRAAKKSALPFRDDLCLSSLMTQRGCATSRATVEGRRHPPSLFPRYVRGKVRGLKKTKSILAPTCPRSSSSSRPLHWRDRSPGMRATALGRASHARSSTPNCTTRCCPAIASSFIAHSTASVSSSAWHRVAPRLRAGSGHAAYPS